jgi:hypothetical protein
MKFPVILIILFLLNSPDATGAQINPSPKAWFATAQ